MIDEVSFLKRLKSMSLAELRVEAGMLTEQWMLLRESLNDAKEKEQCQNKLVMIEKEITKRYQK